jgi:hypothetical protein
MTASVVHVTIWPPPYPQVQLPLPRGVELQRLFIRVVRLQLQAVQLQRIVDPRRVASRAQFAFCEINRWFLGWNPRDMSERSQSVI